MGAAAHGTTLPAVCHLGAQDTTPWRRGGGRRDGSQTERGFRTAPHHTTPRGKDAHFGMPESLSHTRLGQQPSAVSVDSSRYS